MPPGAATMDTVKGKETQDQSVKNLLIYKPIMGNILKYTVEEYKSIIVWLGTQIFGIANTPSCLVKFATGSVNGALWTIFVEIQLYVVLGVIYPKLKKLVNKEWYIFLGVLVAINIFAGYIAEKMGGLPAKLLERVFLPYAIWFFIGVFCYVRREDVLTKLSKFFFPLLVLYIFIRLIPFAIPGYYADIVVGVLCPLITIGGRISCLRFDSDVTSHTECFCTIGLYLI